MTPDGLYSCPVEPDGSRGVRLDCCLIRVRAAFAPSIIKDDTFSNAISGVLLVEASVGRSSPWCAFRCWLPWCIRGEVFRSLKLRSSVLSHSLCLSSVTPYNSVLACGSTCGRKVHSVERNHYIMYGWTFIKLHQSIIVHLWCFSIG